MSLVSSLPEWLVDSYRPLDEIKISSAVDLANHQKEYEEARTADSEVLRRKLEALQRSDSEVLRQFNVHQSAIIEAMIAMQNVRLFFVRYELWLTLSGLEYNPSC